MLGCHIRTVSEFFFFKNVHRETITFLTELNASVYHSQGPKTFLCLYYLTSKIQNSIKELGKILTITNSSKNGFPTNLILKNFL